MSFYLKSEQVKVFPSAYRGKNLSQSKLYDPESRLNSEKNLTEISNKLSSRDSYVLTKVFPVNKKITINIHGYWFELDLSTTSQYNSFNNLYAGIKIEAKNSAASTDTTNTLYEALSLAPLEEGIENDLDDTSGNFIGLILAETEADLSDCSYILHLLTKQSGNWIINPESLLKYDSTDVANGVEGEVSINEEFDTISFSANSAEINSLDVASSAYIENAEVGSKLDVITTSASSGLFIKDSQNNTIESTTTQEKTLTKDLIMKGISSTQEFIGGGEFVSNSLVFENQVIHPCAKLGLYYGYSGSTSFRIKYNFESREEDYAGYCLDLGEDGFTLDEYETDWDQGGNPTPSSTPIFSCNGSTIHLYKSTHCYSNIIPYSNHDLGSSTNKWYRIYGQKSYFTELDINNTLKVNSSGTLTTTSYIEAQYFNSTSDERLKENIKNYKCSKSILDLPIKEFDFKEDGSHHIGCIAQDLKEICPEIVHENEKGYLTIEENKIVYLLLEEVKKLKEEIKKLKGE